MDRRCRGREERMLLVRMRRRCWRVRTIKWFWLVGDVGNAGGRRTFGADGGDFGVEVGVEVVGVVGVHFEGWTGMGW